MLDFAAHAACPERSAFVDAIVSRSPAAEERTSGEARVRIKVELEGTAKRTSGVLTLQLSDGQESRRDVPDAPCEEVLASMAVMVAMILDGADLDAPLPAGDAADAPEAPEERATAKSLLLADDRPRRVRRAARGGDRAAGVRFGVVAGAHVEAAAAPGGAVGASTGVDAELEVAAVFAPSFRLEARIAEAWVESTRYGDADFWLRSAALSGCALRLPISRRFAVRACAVVEAGRLSGNGSHTQRAARQDMLWLGVGAAPRLVAHFGSLAEVELEGRLLALARHDRFVFRPDVVAHDVPRLAPGLRLGLVLRLP